MSSFAASTDKILETGISNSSLNSQSSPTQPAENRRLKIAAAVVFVLLALVAAAALVGIYLSQPPPPPEVFTIILKDADSERPARLKVKYDKMAKVEYTMSPTVDNPGEIIYMLKDYNRALVAHKDFQQGLCLVGRLNDTEDSAKQRAKAYKNRQMQVAATENFLIVNVSVHPEVLEFAAGERIASYCASLPAHWIVRFEPSREVPSVNEQEVHQNVEKDLVTVKASPVDESTGEDEKMQMLSVASGGSIPEPEHELPPPQDPVLIQKAEDIALLEEKTSILAEKLDIPEESIRPGNPVDEKLAILEAELMDPLTSDIHENQRPFANIFSQSPVVTEDGEEGAKGLKGDVDEEEGNLFADRINSEEKLGDEKTEDIKSSADEKSTVEKAPHIHEDHFAIDKEEKEIGLSSTNFPWIDGDGSSMIPTSDILGQLHGRRRKRSSPCTIHCWYYIRKIKGYRRCFHKCF